MAQTINLTIDQGSFFEYNVEIDGTIDLTGATPYAAMKREYTTNDSPIFFSSNIVGSNVVLSMPDTQTANLASGTWVYDAILVSSSNTVVRIFQGKINVTPRVTPYGG